MSKVTSKSSFMRLGMERPTTTLLPRGRTRMAGGPVFHRPGFFPIQAFVRVPKSKAGPNASNRYGTQARRAFMSSGVILRAGLSSLRLSQLMTLGENGGAPVRISAIMRASRRADSFCFTTRFRDRVSAASTRSRRRLCVLPTLMVRLLGLWGKAEHCVDFHKLVKEKSERAAGRAERAYPFVRSPILS